ncbi:MFS transporter [Streptomyces werraensis]|uniref:MFS transporter n=1 Tax=Streptomyces werraensis TaxID=68284 RepID=UPI001CE30467
MSGEAVSNNIKSRRRSLAAVTFGNALEWYEWAAYSIFAPFIAAAMFQDGDPISALLKTFAVFAIGFFMRPVGGILFGRIADRTGRKTVLVMTLLMMGAGSLTIGLLPDFDAIGIWASVILLAARMLQGLAHGGETATSNSYVSELAPPNRRGLWSSISFVALLSGTIFAFLLGVLLLAIFGTDAVSGWAWRLPFLFGGAAAVVVLFVRRRMDESEVFSDAKKINTMPSVPARQMIRPIFTSIGLICGLTVFQYTWLSFVPAHAIVSDGMDAQAAYLAVAGAQLIAVTSLPLWGRLSDRIGRRPVFAGWGIAVAVLQVPLFAMVTGEAWTLFVASAIAWVVAAATGAIQSAAMAEQFSTRQRTFGIGLAFSISVAVFGGTTPYLNEWLYAHDVAWLATAYVIASALVTSVTALTMPERAGTSLAEIDLVNASADAGPEPAINARAAAERRPI